MEKKNQKYQIADIQQDKLLHMGLDLKDAFILSYLREMSQLNNIIKKVVDKKTFIWIDYDKLLSYLPVLKISNSEVIGRRFKKYEKAGLLIKHLHKTIIHGTYTFFYLEDNFFDLFEISKVNSTDEEIEKQMEKMGLSEKSTQKSGGFDSKVGSISTQKSVDNTPINILQEKDSSSTEDKTPAAAPHNDFIKNLKELLSGSSIKNLNQNTLKNIITFSNNDIQVVERAIAFMKLKNKSMTPNILVAILRDGDFNEKGSVTPKEVKRIDKINFIANRLGEFEVRKLRVKILKSIGFECTGIDDQLGNILCRKFNEYIAKGGIYV